PGRAVRPWLYAIATNQAIDALRRRNRRIADRPADAVAAPDEDGEPRPLFELLPAAGEAPADAAERGGQREMARGAVAPPPDVRRQAGLLVYFQGLKYQDAADALGIPVGTVKPRLHAALTKLTEEWTGGQDSEDAEKARLAATRSGAGEP